jgi:hypothetical protein
MTEKKSAPLPISADAAREFLSLLDPYAAGFHFQTFDDVTALKDGKPVKRGSKKLVKTAFGPLDKLLEQFTAMNREGAGIFVTVNQTDRAGRKAENIVKARAVWGDFDNGLPASFPLAPSIVVFSSLKNGVQRGQALWLLDTDEDMTAEEHHAVLERLVKDHGADPAAALFNQVLRLPGFYHMKNPSAPHCVTFQLGNDAEGNVPVYSRDEILQAFPPFVKQKADPVARDQKSVVELDLKANLSSAREYVKHDAPSADQGNRNETAFRVANHIGDFGVSQATALELLEEWNAAKCVPPIEEDELQAIVENAYKSRQNALGIRALTYQLEDLTTIEETDDGTGEKRPAKTQRKAIIWPVTIKNKDGSDSQKPDASHPKNVAALVHYMGAKIKHNEFTGDDEIENFAPFRDVDDACLNKLWAFARAQGLKIAFDMFVRYVEVLARQNPYHPIRDYLASLKWDGIPRVDTWLSLYAGAENTDLHRGYARATLIGAVHRVLQPGYKHDTALVLEGIQGSGKSSLIAALGGEWYGDSLTLGLDPKETIEQTRAQWIVELPELSGMQARDIERIKKQISCQVDRARMSYGRKTGKWPRQFVLIGSTNDRQYLRDRTGNRRFMCVATGTIDVAGLLRSRDQLWAEAYARAKKGESNVLPAELWAEASMAQEKRLVSDPVEEVVMSLLHDRTGRIEKEDLWCYLGKPRAADRTHTNALSLTAAMRRIGWEPERLRRDGKRVEAYSKSVPSLYSGWLCISGDVVVTEKEFEESGDKFQTLN